MKTKRHDSILADARRQFAAKRRGRKFSHLFEAKKHNWKLIIPIVAGLIFFVNYSALISKKSHPISSFLDFFINFFLGKLAISPYILMYFFSLLSSESPPLLEPEMPYECKVSLSIHNSYRLQRAGTKMRAVLQMHISWEIWSEEIL